MSAFLFAAVLVLSFVPTARATPQAGSLLRVDGTNHYVHGAVLTEEAHTKLQEWKEQEGQSNVESSANWKGYYVSLEILNNRLFISTVAIDAYSDAKRFHRMNVPLRELFGKKGPIFASWFSGHLTQYLGPREGYTHWSRRQRRYHFEKGVLLKVEDVTEKENGEPEN